MDRCGGSRDHPRSKTLAGLAAWEFVRTRSQGAVELATVLPGAVFGPILSVGTTDKARRVLGWQPRPARQALLDCARSFLAHGAAVSRR